VPDDPDLLAAIAKVAIGDGCHDLELKMALKSVKKLTPKEARRRYRREFAQTGCDSRKEF
jgi:hypothetical protein